jgi:hypothetical protein
MLRAAGADTSRSEFLQALGTDDSAPLEVWQDQHHHDLHTAARIEAALRDKCRSVSEEASAYFFRYVAAAACSTDLVAAVLDHELQAIDSGRIVALGRRWVASR